MITIQILQNNDILQEDDWCRPLLLTTMSGGMSDDYSFTNMYSGTPENNVKWCQVGISFPYWVDGTLGKLKRRVLYEFGDYEFVRGTPPRSHIHPNGRMNKDNRKLVKELRKERVSIS